MIIIEKIVLVMTTKCNLNCLYCYQKRYKPIDLDFNHIIALVKFINNSKIFSKKICFTFYGGEPLLKLNEIKKIKEYIDKNLSKL